MWNRAAGAVLAMARGAHRDVAAFHEFVQRDEASQDRIRTLPFQCIIFDFIEACPKCVLMLPPGFSKTNCVLSRTMWRVGHDPTRRVMYLSKEHSKAEKFVTTIKTYIESSSELRLVFPSLKPSERRGEPWTQGAITVDRPMGIKDPTVVASSEKTGVAGFRLSDIIVDDILDQLNTKTPEAREKTWRQHEDILLHRLDQGARHPDTRFVVMNTAWDQDDYLHRLMDNDPQKFGAGWPALLMDVYGNVWVKNVSTEVWDPPGLRPARSNTDRAGRAINAEGPFRVSASDDAYAKLTGDDPDTAPLWWQRFGHKTIEKLQSDMTQIGFNQAYLLKCRTEETARCKQEWIDRCIKNGRLGTYDANGVQVCPPHHSMVTASIEHPYQTMNPVVLGADLAFGIGETHDSNSISIWEFLPSGYAKLLWLKTFQCNSPEMQELIYERAKAFGDCHVVVESVGAQKMMVDNLRRQDRSLKLRSFKTSGTGAGMTNKWDQVTGVEGMFATIRNGGWILPCAPGARIHKEIEELTNACLYFLATSHTPDVLMATWFAHAVGRKLAAYAAQASSSAGSGMVGATTR